MSATTELLLDANTVICYFKGMPAVVEHWHATAPARMAVSAIVWHELLSGATLSARPERRLHDLAVLSRHLRILPFTAEEAGESATIRAELHQIRQPIGPLDLLIAATARKHRLAVVTNNTKEFQRVPGLTVVDWTQPRTR